MLQSLFIINKSGGLVFHRYLSPTTVALSTNELLRIGCNPRISLAYGVTWLFVC